MICRRCRHVRRSVLLARPCQPHRRRVLQRIVVPHRPLRKVVSVRRDDEICVPRGNESVRHALCVYSKDTKKFPASILFRVLRLLLVVVGCVGANGGGGMYGLKSPVSVLKTSTLSGCVSVLGGRPRSILAFLCLYSWHRSSLIARNLSLFRAYHSRASRRTRSRRVSSLSSISQSTLVVVLTPQEKFRFQLCRRHPHRLFLPTRRASCFSRASASSCAEQFVRNGTRPSVVSLLAA